MHFGREGAVELCFPTSEDVVFCINTNIRMTMLQQLRIQKRYYRVKLYYLRECLIFFQYSITQNLIANYLQSFQGYNKFSHRL